MKRVNLLDYFDLAEALVDAKRAASVEKSTAGAIFFSTYELPSKLNSFAADDNGFSTCKTVARGLSETIESWHKKHLYGENGEFSIDRFDVELISYQYSDIVRRIDTFRSVFEAECRDVDVYSVGQISIYKTSALVSGASGAIPSDIAAHLPPVTLEEFDNAGRCLAFDLPTACGFHALRGLELVMDAYLNSFGVTTSGFRSWNDYISAASELSKQEGAGKKPSAKVTAMLDRMRSLDRNPLMHPRDKLDPISADMLFRLATITVVEMSRDMGGHSPTLDNMLISGQAKKKTMPVRAKESL